jgi:hypothetical protein
MSTDAIERLLPLTPLSTAILLGLAEGARHGYAIMKEVERQTDGRLTPGAGSLYAAAAGRRPDRRGAGGGRR